MDIFDKNEHSNTQKFPLWRLNKNRLTKKYQRGVANQNTLKVDPFILRKKNKGSFI